VVARSREGRRSLYLVLIFGRSTPADSGVPRKSLIWLVPRALSRREFAIREFDGALVIAGQSRSGTVIDGPLSFDTRFLDLGDRFSCLLKRNHECVGRVRRNDSKSRGLCPGNFVKEEIRIGNIDNCVV
jgi:hypothetical protein